MANFTKSISPSAPDSIMSSQSDKISASLSLTQRLALATSTSAFAELMIQSDSFLSGSSKYFGQNASSLIRE